MKNLVIHDLDGQGWEKIKADYEGWNVFADNGGIRPCMGCFGCWAKTPGECVIKDGYDRVGQIFKDAEEIVVISRWTFGGFSPFVKNIFDRSIGHALPFFQMIDGEMHHVPRYEDEKIDLYIRFYGEEPSEEEKEVSREYVRAVCRNTLMTLKEVSWNKTVQPSEGDLFPAKDISGLKEKPLSGTVFLNASTRGNASNSKAYLEKLGEIMGVSPEILNINDYRNSIDTLADLILPAEKLVIAMPLYLDGIPAQVIPLLEKLYEKDAAGGKKVYVIANMGFYESIQIRNMLALMKVWCRHLGYVFGGGLAVGAGGTLKKMMEASGAEGPAKKAVEGLEKLAEAVKEGGIIPDIYADPYNLSIEEYTEICHSAWYKWAEATGLSKEDLFRKMP
ncbi:MAG: flavodoxin family protein [Eubacterium sp.]|nr:flavodoxin family protein [Eubacterium sp.]